MLISKTAMAGLMLLLVLLLQGCGRKGPLFMQQEPARPVAAAAPTPTQPEPIQSVPNQTIPNQPELKK